MGGPPSGSSHLPVSPYTANPDDTSAGDRSSFEWRDRSATAFLRLVGPDSVNCRRAQRLEAGGRPGRRPESSSPTVSPFARLSDRVWRINVLVKVTAVF